MDKLYKILMVLLFVVPCAHADDFIDMEFSDSNDIVFTPSRLEQHKSNVPAGVTVITAEKLKNLGISSLPEAMRLVPGMRINQASGWDYRINFHGTNGLIPRRMLVLIDGMSIYRYGMAQVDWNRIGLDVEDIARIEVTRSPSAVSYGSNAFQAVVNIITKHPKDVEKALLLVQKGSKEEKVYLRVGGEIENTSYSLSLSERMDDGFDMVSFGESSGKEPIPGGVDGQRVKYALLRTDTVIDDQKDISFRLGASGAALEDEEAGPTQLAPPEIDQNEYFAQINYSHILNEQHHLKVGSYFRSVDYDEHWNACFPAAYFLTELRELALVNRSMAMTIADGKMPTGPASDIEKQLIGNVLLKFNSLGATALAPLCVDANNDIAEQTADIQIEDTFKISEKITINSGIGYKNNKAESETLLNGSIYSEHAYAFSNAEILLNDLFVLNAGLIYENVSNIDENVWNPRIGLNYHYTDNDTIRFVYSTSSRLPTILESDGNWNYYGRNWNREFDGRREGIFYLNTVPINRLEPETNTSREIGFYGVGTKNKYEYDVRVFKENLRNLISEKPEFFNFLLSNDNWVDLSGIEAEVSYRIHTNLEVSTGYSYIDTTYSNYYEQTAHSDHSGFVNFTQLTSLGTFSLAYYGNSEIANEQYGRFDMTYLNQFKAGFGANILIKGTASYYTNTKFVHESRAGGETSDQVPDQFRSIYTFEDPVLFTALFQISY